MAERTQRLDHSLAIGIGATAVGVAVAAGVTALALSNLDKISALHNLTSLQRQKIAGTSGSLSGLTALLVSHALFTHIESIGQENKRLLQRCAQRAAAHDVLAQQPESIRETVKNEVSQYRNSILESTSRPFHGGLRIPTQTVADSQRMVWKIGSNPPRNFTFFENNNPDSKPLDQNQNEFFELIERLAPNGEAEAWTQDILEITSQGIVASSLERLTDQYTPLKMPMGAPGTSLVGSMQNVNGELQYNFTVIYLIAPGDNPYSDSQDKPQAHQRLLANVTFKKGDDDATLIIHEPIDITAAQDAAERAARRQN